MPVVAGIASRALPAPSACVEGALRFSSQGPASHVAGSAQCSPREEGVIVVWRLLERLPAGLAGGRCALQLLMVHCRTNAGNEGVRVRITVWRTAGGKRGRGNCIAILRRDRILLRPSHLRSLVDTCASSPSHGRRFCPTAVQAMFAPHQHDRNARRPRWTRSFRRQGTNARAADTMMTLRRPTIVGLSTPRLVFEFAQVA